MALTGFSDELALWLQCDFCRYVSVFIRRFLRLIILLLERCSSYRECGIKLGFSEWCSGVFLAV